MQPIKQYYDAAEAMPWWIDMLPLLLTVLLMGGFWYILMKRSGGGGQPHGLCQAETQAAGSPQPCYL